MKLAHVSALCMRELREITRSKMILVTMAILPGMLVTIALLTESTLMGLPDDVFDATGAPPELLARFADLGPKISVMALLNEQFMSMLLVIAAALPATIAAHSIIGEKVERTLEPLLATPISTVDLVVGKALVGMVPALVLSWLSYAVTVAGIAHWGTPELVSLVVRPVWPLAFGLVAPLLSLGSVLATLALSSRVNDPRTAQGVSAFLILPLFGVGISALSGAITLDVSWVLAAAVMLAILDVILIRVVVWVFGRETILSRWR